MTDRAPDNRIPEATLEEIRRRTDIIEIASYMGARFEASGGDQRKALCILHKEKTASFTANRKTGRFKCWGCGAGGSAFDLVSEVEGLSFLDAVVWLADRAGIALPDRTPPKIAKRAVVVTADPVVDAAAGREKQRKAKEKFWLPSKPIAGTVVELYLAEVRAIRHAVFKDLKSLRFLPDVPYWANIDDRWQIIHSGPAMVAGMQTMGGGFSAAHITYLNRDGTKLTLYKPDGSAYDAKKIQGLAGGAHIRLAPPDKSMAVGEGIETALSCNTAGGPNAWSAGSLDNICGGGRRDGYRAWHPNPDPTTGKKRKLPTRVPDMDRPGFVFPACVEEGLILGDGDTKDQHMLRCKLTRAERRFTQMGVQTATVISPPGTDFNDILRDGIPQGA